MGSRFRGDTRGVSEVVGAVLLLGILMLTLSIYQVSVVPNQNAATEFDHNQQVEDEMVDVRNAILEARSSGKDTFASVTLGTRYQDRTLTVNPPSPTGTIQTVEQPNINVTEEGGEMRDDPLGLADRPLENQFVEYSPRYYEYDAAGTMRYENTIAYHDYGDATVYLTNQTLLRGETVSLIPLEGTFRKAGTQRVAIEPKPGVLETVEVDDPNVTVPTELSEDEWQDLLENELETGETVTVSDGNLTLSLDGTYDVAYAPVGVNRLPEEGERGSSGTEINPAAPGDVQLVGAEWNNNLVELTFRNSADDTNFTEGRINFFTGNSDPTFVDAVNAVGAGSNPRGTDWQIGNDFENLDPNILLDGDGATTSIELDFDTNLNDNQDFFIVTLTLENGQQATYFVSGEFSFTGGGGGGSGELDITNVNREGSRSLSFSADNIGSNSIDLVAIEVDNPSRTTFNDLEITGPSSNVVLNGPLNADGTRIDHSSLQLQAAESASYRLVNFNGGGSGNIAGDSVRLRIYYEVGGSEEYYEETVTVP